MQYTVIIRKVPTGRYISSCPLIPECHAQGDTLEECVENTKEALALCLDFRRERGEEVPDESNAERVVITV
ncbi:MAG: HicB-like protein [Dehalococcoidia bacterium]|nr:HicB-like protein [Dehalococcoidia bacterium]